MAQYPLIHVALVNFQEFHSRRINNITRSIFRIQRNILKRRPRLIWIATMDQVYEGPPGFVGINECPFYSEQSCQLFSLCDQLQRLLTPGDRLLFSKLFSNSKIADLRACNLVTLNHRRANRLKDTICGMLNFPSITASSRITLHSCSYTSSS